jgi:hypothetical protein
MVISSAAVFVLAATVTRIRCNVNGYNGEKNFPAGEPCRESVYMGDAGL